MKIYYGLKSFRENAPRKKPFAIAIGIFDGVHRAHQKILKKLVRESRRKSLRSLVITFWPHPEDVVKGQGKKVPHITSLRHRLRLIGGMGVDFALVIRFTRKLAGMEAAGFARAITEGIPVNEIITGSNFYFGRNKRGTPEFLKKFSRGRFRVTAIKVARSGGKPISSTRIRNLILDGRLKEAQHLLSRPVTVLGTVVKGKGRGRFLGFPTANIDPHHEAIPPSGVYAVRVKLEGKEYKGILNIGTRPTFESGKERAEPVMEVNLFGFTGNMYGRDLEIMFAKRIRSERRYRNPEALRNRIMQDAFLARKILAR